LGGVGWRALTQSFSRQKHLAPRAIRIGCREGGYGFTRSKPGKLACKIDQHGPLAPKRPSAERQANQTTKRETEEKPYRLTIGGILPCHRHVWLGEQDHYGKGW
jgi:hypothetical protein